MWKVIKKDAFLRQSCPAVKAALDHGLVIWINGLESESIPLSPLNKQDPIGTLIHHAAVAQKAIGWGQLIQGRISEYWGRANAEYRLARFNTKDLLPSRWSANITYHLWKFGMSRWISCNEFVYGKTEQEKLDKRNNDIDAKLTSMFLFDRNKVNPADAHLFELPKEERLQHTFDQKRLWVASVQAAVAAWEQTATNHAVSQQNNEDVLNSPPGIHCGPPSVHKGRRPRVRLRGK